MKLDLEKVLGELKPYRERKGEIDPKFKIKMRV